MADLSKLDIEFDCSSIEGISAWSSKLSVELEDADTTSFVNDYQEEILEHIGEEEVGEWLERQGYKVEAE